MPAKQHVKLVAAMVVAVSAAARPGFADVPADTIRAAQCPAVTEPDTVAAWFHVIRDWSRETPGAWSNDSLRTVLLALAKNDQAVRDGFTAASMKDSAFMWRMRSTDSVNTTRMRVILARYGWPGKSMVGARGADAAYLLVQHSAELGPEGLALMQAAKPGEVSPADLALVIDRQRTNTGRPQVYGSQLHLTPNGLWLFFPIEQPAHVDERRATAGLPPLRAYACMMATIYKASVVFTDELPN